MVEMKFWVFQAYIFIGLIVFSFAGRETHALWKNGSKYPAGEINHKRELDQEVRNQGISANI